MTLKEFAEVVNKAAEEHPDALVFFNEWGVMYAEPGASGSVWVLLCMEDLRMQRNKDSRELVNG